MKITALEESSDFATLDTEKLFSKLKSHVGSLLDGVRLELKELKTHSMHAWCLHQLSFT
jgi:hypothetical protein